MAAWILPALLVGLLPVPPLDARADSAAQVTTDGRSGIRLLSVDDPPVIRGQPFSQGAVVNLSAVLQVYAEGAAPLGYFWFKDGAPLPAATNLSVLTNGQLQFLPFLTNDAGAYHVVVSNAYGTATSELATLTALPNPYISQQPESQIVIEGGAAAISIVAQGSAPVYYYWYKDGVQATNISISTGTLLFTSVAATNAGVYQIIVSNAVGTATSDLATLVVKPNTARLIRTLDLELPEPTSLVVPIEFAAQGDENSLGFSLRFNPEIVQFQTAQLTEEAAAALPGTEWTVTEAQADQGTVGFLLARAPGEVMPVQTLRLAEVRFALVMSNWVQAGLVFDNAPVQLAALDTDAVALPVLDQVSPMLGADPLPSAADTQSGLFEQTVTVINPGGVRISGLEVLVRGLTEDSLGRPIRLVNASGSTNDVPVVYYGPLLPGTSTELTLSYYVSDRLTAPAPVFETRVVPARQFVATGGQVFTITSVRYAEDRAILEFYTLPGRTYYVEYVDAIGALAWRTALPSVRGTGSRVQWIDDGPPKTISRPASASSRFYRGMLMP